MLVVAILSTEPASSKLSALTDRITIDWNAPIARFRPSEAFGVAIDGGTPDEVRRLFLPANRPALAALSGMPASYRLRTELGIEAWHWRSRGRWSDTTRQQGYWTGDVAAQGNDAIGYGYRLPRRGDTHDEANDDGYSRIDDGDARSFWKSNPFLDEQYTGVTGEHPEWVVIELPHAQGIDGIDIHWALPFACRFEVQYWVGQDEYSGRWVTFPEGRVTNGRGGDALLRLASAPITTRFVRVLMTASSQSATEDSEDPRDALGFAVAEIGLGHLTAGGRLVDIVRHSPGHARQTVIHVSSTDPWHRAIDKDAQTAQPSVVTLEQKKIIGRGPLMMPVGIMYDTPENMLAMLDHLQRRGIAVDRVELGEEPDGQLVSAEDYGALYVEFAKQIQRRFPALSVGGPSLVNGVSDTWLDASPDESWTSHFIRYLRSRNALDRLGFFSFEYFPFDNVCGAASERLRAQTLQMRDLYKRLGEDSVPKSIPWFITELGYSAFGGAPLVQMPSALVTADIYGDLLRQGGKGGFAYGITPDDLISGPARCAGQGNLMFWLADHKGQASYPMPSLRALEMLARQWTVPGRGVHQLYASKSILRDNHEHTVVTSYALNRPDARWSVLLVNRSAASVETFLNFEHAGARPDRLAAITVYSGRHYRWDRPKPDGHPSVDAAPLTQLDRSWNDGLTLAPMSLTVVTGTWSR